MTNPATTIGHTDVAMPNTTSGMQPAPQATFITVR